MLRKSWEPQVGYEQWTAGGIGCGDATADIATHRNPRGDQLVSTSDEEPTSSGDEGSECGGDVTSNNPGRIPSWSATTSRRASTAIAANRRRYGAGYPLSR